MNIWNNVFLGLIFILSIAVTFLASQNMIIKNEWSKSILAHEKKIEDLKKQTETTARGSDPLKKASEKTFSEMSMDELRLKLHDFIFERKKAWFGCKPGNVDVAGSTLTPQQLGGDNPPTAADQLKEIKLVEVKLTIVGPVVTDKEGKEEIVPPDDLKGIVYLFDEGTEGVGGSFLGRYSVIKVEKTQNGYQVVLHAANDLSETEIQRIQKSIRSTWSLYASMPMDRFQGVFDRLSPDDAEKLIPAAIRAELTKSDRKLRDFDELLNILNARRVEVLQNIDLSNRAIQKNNESLEIANKEEQALRNDGEMTKKRIAAMEDQRKTLQTKVDEFDAMIKTLNEQIEETQKQNEWFVAKIAEYQLKVAEIIEKRAQDAGNQP